jgi:hypothetical protein
MTGLESAYRRLVRLYPLEHRRVYGEEMLTVLLADSTPGQRRPRPAQAVDLILAASRLHLGSVRASLHSGQWNRAFGVFSLIAALMLASEHLRPLLADYALFGSLRPQGTDGVIATVQLAAWVVTAIFVLKGLRRLAIVGAWIGVAGAVAWLVAELPHWQSDVVMTWWQHLLAVMCACALTAMGKSEPVSVLGRSRVAILFGMSALTAGTAALNITLFGSPTWIGISVPWPWFDTLTAAVLLAYALAIAVIVWLLPAPTRRRVLVLLAPPAGMLTAGGTRLLDSFLGYGNASNVVVLTVASLLLLAAGAAYAAFRERRAHLIALGRAAELTADPPGEPA